MTTPKPTTIPELKSAEEWFFEFFPYLKNNPNAKQSAIQMVIDRYQIIIDTTRAHYEAVGREQLVYLNDRLDKLLNHCNDAECEECSKLICPFKDPLHFHHDGCPSCHNVPKEHINKEFEISKSIEHAIHNPDGGKV